MLRNIIAKVIKRILSKFNYIVIPEKILYDFQTDPSSMRYVGTKLSEGSQSYLQPTNPKLQELQKRYETFDDQVTTPLLWTEDRVQEKDLLYFRGHNAYVYQIGSQNRNILGYLLQAYYLKLHDPLNLWDQLEEDGDHGVVLFSIDGKAVSRDLLDSILEINFLHRHLDIKSWPDLTILDIGAGYGRLAHRVIRTFPNLSKYLCTDAVPVSTFINQFYLESKNLTPKGEVISVDRIEKQIENYHIDLAINIHSFSECSLDAIEWWVNLLHNHKVQKLFVIPNSRDKLMTMNKEDFQPILEKYGYQLIRKEPKYADQLLQKYAANPSYYYLFDLAHE